MFKSSARRASEQVSNLDFTQLLSDSNCYSLGNLIDLGISSQLTALAFDPVQSLLAVATEEGKIFIFGKLGVECSWDLGRPVKIKHLAFRSGFGFLCIIDSKDTLTIYDLTRFEKTGKPIRDVTLSMRSTITCIETSTSHPFLFLGGRDGSIDIFDIDRGCIITNSRIPNLWLGKEEILRRSGVQDAPSSRHIPACTDIKAHPLNLNLLLIAYEGGVSLWNIAEKREERSWEISLPPGAPGGGNDEEEKLFSERRLNVTCLAWRPDGLLFAIGHEDGCISFAFISDDLPITIRTLERADVHKTTEADLFGWSSQGEIGERKPSGRESIFKLAWSSFPEESYLDMARNGWNGSTSTSTTGASGNIRTVAIGTVLTIMGGILPQDPTGIHVLEFPTYLPPSSHPISANSSLSAPQRQALKDSITPISHNFYPTSSPPEDFLLLPRDSPHYSLSYDPTSIIITTGSDSSLPVLINKNGDRSIEAWSFPITTTINTRRMNLPDRLNWNGNSSCTSVEVFNVSRFTYQKLTGQNIVDESINLKGGKANSKMRPTASNKKARGESNEPRIMVSGHVDLTIRFHDVSDHLLIRENENGLMEQYPKPLNHLTFDIKDLLRKMENQGGDLLEANRILRERSWELEIIKFSWAYESLELAVLLSTGDVIVAKFGHSVEGSNFPPEAEQNLDDTVNEALRDMDIDSNSQDLASSHVIPPSRTNSLRSKSTGPIEFQDMQDRCINLSHLQFFSSSFIDTFIPAAAFSLTPPETQSCLSLSDIGFLATSSGCDLLIADLRGPDVLLYDSMTSSNGSSGKGKGKGKLDSSVITSLTWSISAMSQDHDRNPRLIVIQASGLTRVFELSQIGSSWHLSTTPITFSHDSLRNTFKTFVIDKLGSPIHATPQVLQQALAHQNNISSRTEDVKGTFSSIWITISPTTISTYFNIDGSRTSIYEDNIGFESAEMVMRLGCLVLVVASKNKSVTIFSVPELLPIFKTTFAASVHSSAGSISFSQDGDLFQYFSPSTIRLQTIFDISRPSFPPNTTLHNTNIIVPLAPQFIPSLNNAKGIMSSFFGGEKVYGAYEIEGILGGPNRPPPKLRTVLSPSTPQEQSQPIQAPNRIPRQKVQEEVESTQSILGRTTEALNERGESLSYLQEKLGSMANEAAKMATEAKKMAQREAGKKALMGGFTSFFK